MKQQLRTTLLLLVFGSLAGPLFSQQPPTLSANFHNTNLKSALRVLERQNELSFSYEDEAVDGIRVTAKFKRLPLPEAMRQLLDGTELSFEIVDNQYVLLTKKQPENAAPPAPRPAEKLTLCGRILDAASGEPLPGATAYIPNSAFGAGADAAGNFSFSGHFTKDKLLEISYLGYERRTMPAAFFMKKTCPEIRLKATEMQMPDVVVREFTTDMVNAGEEGDFRFKKEKIPTLPGWGEPDVLRSLQLLPGIGSADESASNLNVRGGTPDQNLVLWDGIPIYHTGHFFGLYDAFNPFVIGEMDVWRGNFGAEYGGRNSSVIDISSKSDFLTKSRKGFGLNLLSLQGFMELPLRKNRMTLLVAFRRSYTDLIQSKTYQNLFNQVFQNGRVALNEKERQNNDFYSWNPAFRYGDFNLKLTWKGKKKRLNAISIYSGEDHLDYRFSYDDSTYFAATTDLIATNNFGISWQHRAEWSPVFSVKYKVALSGYGNNYAFTWNDDRTAPFKYRWNTDNTMSDFSAYFHHDWKVSERHTMSFGYQLTSQEASLIYRDSLLDDTAHVWRNDVNRTAQHTFYGEFDYRVSPRFRFSLGIRENHFPTRGLYYSEPRVNFTWKPFAMQNDSTASSGRHSDFSIKGGFGRHWQFVFQILDFGDLGVGEPSWGVSNEDFPAQELWQWSLGFTVEHKSLLLDADFYVKTGRNLTSFNLRTDRGFENPGAFDGKSKAAGFDFLLRKRWRAYSLWLSYSTGRVEQQFPELNGGLPYPARHDIRQRLTLVHMLTLGRWDFSGNLHLRGGSPYSRPQVVQKTDDDGSLYYALDYPRLNTERLPGTVRIDLGTNYKFGSDRLKGKIGLTIYNLLDRRNILDKDFLLENTPDDPQGSPYTLQELNRLAAGVTPNLFFQLEW